MPFCQLPPFDPEDPEYLENFSSADQLLAAWKKGLVHIDFFWKLWLEDYVLALRGKTDLFKLGKLPLDTPNIDQIYAKFVNTPVLVKDISLPRSLWRVGKIISFVPSRDHGIRVAKVLMPNGNELIRSVNCLFPLELFESTPQALEIVSADEIPKLPVSVDEVERPRKSLIDRESSPFTFSQKSPPDTPETPEMPESIPRDFVDEDLTINRRAVRSPLSTVSPQSPRSSSSPGFEVVSARESYERSISPESMESGVRDTPPLPERRSKVRAKESLEELANKGEIE